MKLDLPEKSRVLLGRVLCVLGTIFFVLASIAAISRKPLQATILPPYGVTIVVPENTWYPDGWALDASIGGVLGACAFVGWYLLRRSTQGGDKRNEPEGS